ncbi:hypothetical protein BH10PAT3_BH10PAT3_5410 [soil metagenome]
MQDEDKEQPQAGWVFKPGGETPPPLEAASEPVANQPIPSAHPSEVSWSASEYIANPKNTSWYAMLAASSIALAVIVYFITSDVVSTVVIVILGIIVGVFAARQPQVLEYKLDTKGIHLGPRFYPYNTFKTFSVVSEGPFSHISLLPLKRFMPPLAVHYAPEDEDKITKTLADYLPYEEYKRDLVESFSRRVRF